jgi:DNA-directed RNA polymerase alpha subunit
METSNKDIQAMISRDFNFDHEKPLQELFNDRLILERVFMRTIDLVSSVYKSIAYEVLIRYICTGDTKKVSDEFQLTEDRVRQLVNKALRQLRKDTRSIRVELIRRRVVAPNLPPVDLDLPLSVYDFSVRALNVLNRSGVETLRDLVSRSKEELLRFRNMGSRSVREIEEFLTENGLSLREEGVEANNKT